MRTFYSLKTFFVMCVLCMTGTLCALAQTTVTFTAGTDVSSTTSITKDGVTILLTEGNSSSTNGPGKLDQTEYRFYKGCTVVVSSSKGNITKIVFNCTANSTTKYGPGCFEKQTGYSYASKKGTWVGDAASVEFTASSNQVRATTVEVTYVSSSTVTAPKMSEDSKIFREPFDVTITAEESADIYYTLDGSDPTTSSAKYDGAAIHIAGTTTLKAIAVKNGESSSVASATYTYVQALAHDGSFTSPLTPEELIANATYFEGKDVWVKGTVLGELLNSNGQYQVLKSSSTNIILGKSGSSNFIPISLKSNTPERAYCNANTDDLMGKELLFFGTIGTYFGQIGIPSKNVKAFAGPEDSPIASLTVKTDEGYATFVSDYAFYVPEGVECATITDADENGVLNTNYKYKAGYNSNNIVPANYPVLVKADGKKTFNLALASGSGSSAGTNLLKAGKGEDITAESGHHYYKLAYDDFDTKEGLGFYWGAAEGGAFYVPKGNAYLDVPSTSATSVMSFRLEDAVTGIATAEVNGQTEKVAYTIDGRRVDASHLTKGIYIVNGKKVMVK